LLAQHPVPVPSKGNAALENITQNQGIAYRKSKKFGLAVPSCVRDLRDSLRRRNQVCAKAALI
jgi:hypothetical protein